MYVHLVFVTKYRKAIFKAQHLKAMQEVAAKVCLDFGAELRELDGERLEAAYYKGQLWSPSYFAASCGGAPLEKIKEYVRQQDTPSK